MTRTIQIRLATRTVQINPHWAGQGIASGDLQPPRGQDVQPWA